MKCFFKGGFFFQLGVILCLSLGWESMQGLKLSKLTLHRDGGERLGGGGGKRGNLRKRYREKGGIRVVTGRKIR